jgi:hypothetical protein
VLAPIVSHGHPHDLPRLELASGLDEGLDGGQDTLDHGLGEEHLVVIAKLGDE